MMKLIKLLTMVSLLAVSLAAIGCSETLAIGRLASTDCDTDCDTERARGREG